MPRASLVVSIACLPYLAACSKLAELAGAPNRDAATIVFHNMLDSIFVGDSLAVFVDVNGADGRPAKTDTVVVWVSSNSAVVALSASNPPIPTPHGFSWLYGRGSGQATVTAHTTNVTASKVVTVVGPSDIAADDQRFGYTLADQPTATSAYSPALRFNSSGGGVTVTHDSAGIYTVRFAGLARKQGQRDNVQVTAYGAPPGTHCKLYEWSSDGSDFVVPVQCHAPGLSEPFVDARFTVLVSGARAYDPSTPFAFSERLPATNNLPLDTSATSFNSVTGHILLGGAGVGAYDFEFPGVVGTGPIAVQSSAVGQGAARCHIAAYDLSHGALLVSCVGADGVQVAARPSVMWFTRGRVGHRYGFVTTGNLAATAQPTNPLFTFNSAGGAVTSRRVGASQWAITFAGLGRPVGGSEIVVLSAFTNPDHSCTIVSWGNTGVKDLTVTLQCFDVSGSPFDGAFNVLVVE
jgi:hypothetical protein